MNLDIKNIDITKADLGLRHDYIPQTEWNLAEKDEDKRVVFDCEYFTLGEKMKYSTVGEDNTMSIDFQKVFKKKVKGIRNLSICEKPVTTAEELLKYPGIPELDNLMADVVAHILKADDLTEDETKN